MFLACYEQEGDAEQGENASVVYLLFINLNLVKRCVKERFLTF